MSKRGYLHAIFLKANVKNKQGKENNLNKLYLHTVSKNL